MTVRHARSVVMAVCPVEIIMGVTVRGNQINWRLTSQHCDFETGFMGQRVEGMSQNRGRWRLTKVSRE